MNEALAPSQAHRLVEELQAFCRRTKKEQQEAWKEHAETLPQLRIWLSNAARPGKQTLRNALNVARAAREYGPVVAERTDVSIGTQLLQQLRLHHTHRVPPEGYYFLGMYDDRVRSKARFFLDDTSTSTLLYRLATTAPDDEYEPLHAKSAFWAHCRAHDLPVVPVLAVFEDGSLQQDYADLRDGLPSRDLFSKPVTAYLGRGTRTWRYQGDASFKDSTGRTLPSKSVFEALKKQSEEAPLVLQPRVHDHPQLQTLTGTQGPSTLRIITIRTPGDVPEYFAGFLTTPIKDVPAPTFSERSALAARVEPDSGRLGPPLLKRPDYLLGENDEHPRTERRLTGQKLPEWEEAKTLALQAHATLPNIACVGWDVMLTANGPRLLEGNYDCSATLTQITHQQLLGLTRFPEYLTAHIRATA